MVDIWDVITGTSILEELGVSVFREAASFSKPMTRTYQII
jgi:hypothetical protein